MGRDFFSDSEPDGLIIEEQAGRPQPGSANPPGLRTLVTRNHRMTLSPDDNFSELYDLAEDPNENINLFNAPEAATRRADLMETMLRRMDGFGGLYPHTQETIIERLMNTYKDDAVDKWPTFVPPPAPTGMATAATITSWEMDKPLQGSFHDLEKGRYISRDVKT